MSKCGKGCMPECEYFTTGGCISPFNCMYKEESGYINSATSGTVIYTGGMNMPDEKMIESLKCVIADISAQCKKLEAENAELRARLEKEGGGWISVEEHLPETDNKNTHDFDVLVYVPKRDGCNQHGVYIGKLSHVNSDDGTGNFWGIRTESCDWTVWGWSYIEHPIVPHWKPLPALPIEAEAHLAEE